MSSALAKPKISLILRASVMGGVQTSNEALTNSRLAEKFDFTIVPPDEARRQLRSGEARVFLFEDACSWRRLPELAAFRLRRGRARIVVHEHHYSEGFEHCNVRSRARFRAMLRLSYALADRVVAVSQGQRDWMLRHRLVAPARVAVIRCVPPLQGFFAVPVKPPARPLILAALGRFAPQKGFDILLAAIREIPPGTVQLRIAGGGPDERALKDQCGGLRGVSFVGVSTDVAGFLAECDAVVIPSRWEPGAAVGFEVRAAGKPVIATRVDGLSEQLDGCGLLVEPENPHALAAALAQLAAAPAETLCAWGVRGRGAVAEAAENSLRGWDKLLGDLTR